MEFDNNFVNSVSHCIGNCNSRVGNGCRFLPRLNAAMRSTRSDYTIGPQDWWDQFHDTTARLYMAPLQRVALTTVGILVKRNGPSGTISRRTDSCIMVRAQQNQLTCNAGDTTIPCSWNSISAHSWTHPFIYAVLLSVSMCFTVLF